MKKYFTVFSLALLMTVSGMAVTNYNGNSDKPHITSAPGDQAPEISTPTKPDRPSTAPDKGISRIGGTIPGQAGETAQKVLNTIDEIGSGFELGNTLRNLLGNTNQTRNQTE